MDLIIRIACISYVLAYNAYLGLDLWRVLNQLLTGNVDGDSHCTQHQFFKMKQNNRNGLACENFRVLLT